MDMVFYIKSRVKLSRGFICLSYYAVMNGQKAEKDNGHEGSPFFLNQIIKKYLEVPMEQGPRLGSICPTLCTREIWLK